MKSEVEFCEHCLKTLPSENFDFVYTIGDWFGKCVCDECIELHTDYLESECEQE